MKQKKKLIPGGEIKDVRELLKLSKQRQSVFTYLGGKVLINLPAAFMVQWSLAKLNNQKFFYAIDENDITEVEFEDKMENTKLMAEHINFLNEPSEEAKKQLEELKKIPKSMNIYAPHGTKVKLILDNDGNIKNGYNYQKKRTARKLNKEKEYTVDYTLVIGANTHVYLIEKPGIAFNSILFMEV